MMNEYVEIIITEENHKEASKRLTKLRNSLKGTKLKSRFNVDWETDNYRGQLGEILFENWLDKKLIRYEKDEAYGRPDKYDFLVNDYKLDLKTATRKLPMEELNPDTFKLLVNADQVEEGKHDHYVWCWVRGHDVTEALKAYFMGFYTASAVKHFDSSFNKVRGVRQYEVPVGMVFPMSEFTKILGDSRLYQAVKLEREFKDFVKCKVCCWPKDPKELDNVTGYCRRCQG